MSTQDLQTLLRQLHAELGRADTLDPESRRLLDVVIDDIRRVGTESEGREPDGRRSRDGDAPGTPASSVTPSGLEELAVRFEADHPSTAAALRRLADVLGKAGI